MKYIDCQVSPRNKLYLDADWHVAVTIWLNRVYSGECTTMDMEA